MIKKSHYLGALLILFSCTFTVRAKEKQTLNISVYYELVNNAHLAICKGNFDEAGSLFDKAFGVIKYPFFTDINNAIYSKVNSKFPNKTKIRSYFEMIQRKGICIHDKYKNVPGYSLYLNDIPHSNCALSDSTNYTLLKQIYNTDQNIRTYAIDILNEFYPKILMNSIRTIDSINFKIVDGLFESNKEQNLPLEESFGFQAINEFAFVLLIHGAPWGYTNDTLLSKLCKAGRLDNRLLTTILDAHCSGNYRRGEVENMEWKKKSGCDIGLGLFGNKVLNFINYKAYIPFEQDSSLVNSIDLLRKQYHLPEMYMEAKIRAYSCFNIRNGFYYPGMVSMNAEGLDKRFEKNYQGHNYIKYENVMDYDFYRPFSIH